MPLSEGGEDFPSSPGADGRKLRGREVLTEVHVAGPSGAARKEVVGPSGAARSEGSWERARRRSVDRVCPVRL